MRKIINIALIIIFALAISPAIAQTFPVRVTPILTPPYTPFLTDYTDPGAERLTIQVMLNDLTVTEFRTKLRMTIEGVGITITTNPNYFPPPIALQGGVPQLIYGSDIADYFKMSNLVFQGLNPNEVQKNGGRLPEGIYRISFEVLDYNRNNVVSNKGSATAWMILNDPPFINLPVNNAKLKPLNPQNIVFQWTPRHRGSPNAAFTTDYDVKLVEIWPSGRNPFDAINASRPIFETTTSATMVVYGPAETPLVLGREYALQVRARDTGGRDVFKNNGYSEVVRFIYGDECPMPSGLNADDINISKARMRWQGSGQNSEYLLRYREKKEGSRWFEDRTNQSYYNATGLRAGTAYEYQLVGECLPAGAGDIYQSEYTQSESFITLTENPNTFVCADANSVPPPDGSPPLPALFTNDFIYAGGFDVVVNKATGSNGRFSGEGLAVVPWFNSAKVRVTFENIGVNTSYQLTAGEIKSVWDPNSRSMFVDEKTIADDGGPSSEFNSDIQTFEPDTAIMVTGVILSAYNDPDGNTVLETNEGRTVLPKGTSYAIADEAGNGYIVDKEGNIKKTTATDALAAGAKADREYSTDPNSKISFTKAGDTRYGFDEPQTVLPQNYQQTEAGDKVAWKALATGLPDQVTAASQGVGDVGKATFKLEPSTQVLIPIAIGTNTSSTGQVQLTLTGTGDGVVNELLAYYPNPDTTKTDLVAGKLNVVSYNLVQKNLVLITVNSTTTSLAPGALQADLSNIYSQGVVQWTVNPIQSITVNGIDENALDDGGSGLLSNYTEDMKKILRAYTAAHEMASDTYYLFLVKNATSQSKLGYMPRKKQAGFIFVDAHNNADVVKTIAHELGHGAFHLKHTFSEYPSLSQGVTENLMDYPAKTRLDKWQWDHIHNPEGVLGLFEGDDEGALERVLGGEIVVEFIDVTSDFTPGVNKMIINYRIRNLKEAIGIHPDKKFRATLQVRDKNDNLVYEKELELEDIGRVEWDGFLATDKKDRILYETGPFKIQIKVFGGLESTWDSVVLCFTNLIDCLSGELKTSVSGYAEKVFNVNEDREKWEQFEFKNVDSKASFSDYTSQKNLIIQNLGLDEDINPLDYLNENLIWFEFLGESIVMHKRFAYALKLIKESLSPGDYAELSKVLTISNGFRAHKSTDDGVSRHQLGMAIDINPSSNPMLKSSSQAELFKYIRLATGLDMYNKPVTLNQTIEAQELFRSTVIDRGINSLKVKSSLQRISVYENDPKKFSLEELSQNVIESTLGQILEKFNKVLSESPTESALLENEIKLASPELKKLKLLIDDASEVLNDLSIGLLMDSKKTLEFEEMKKYLYQKSKGVENILNSMENGLIDISEVTSNTLLVKNCDSFKLVSDHIDSLKTWMGELAIFGETLHSKVTAAESYLGGNLFKNGFFNLPEHFSETMENHILIRWGGGPYYRSLKDWMHFEIDNVRELLDIDEDIIDDKLKN